MGRPAIHPGEHLADLLHELDMSAAALSRHLAVPQLTRRGDDEAKRAARQVPLPMLEPAGQVGDPAASHLANGA